MRSVSERVFLGQEKNAATLSKLRTPTKLISRCLMPQKIASQIVLFTMSRENKDVRNLFISNFNLNNVFKGAKNAWNILSSFLQGQLFHYIVFLFLIWLVFRNNVVTASKAGKMKIPKPDVLCSMKADVFILNIKMTAVQMLEVAV